MGWRDGWAAVAMAAMFLVVAFAPMASCGTGSGLMALPTPGNVVNSVTTGDQINPSIFTADDGKVYVVWEDVQGGLSRIFFSMSTDGGVTFSDRLRVDNIVPGAKCLARTPVVVVNSTGYIFVAWSDNRTGTYQIYLASSDDGNNFEADDEPIAASTTWKNQTVPDLDIENDNLFLAWSEYQPSAGNFTYVRFTYSTDSGASFRAPVRPDSITDVIQQYPSLSVRGSKVCLAWHDSRDNPLFDIYLAVSTNNGQSFAPSVKVSGDDDTIGHWYPTVEALPSGRIFVAWQENKPGGYDDFDIKGTKSTTNDATFAASFVIDSSDHDQSVPDSSSDPRGVVSLVYRSDTGSGHRIMYTRSNDAMAFIAPVRADNFAGADQSSPAICSTRDGNAYLVFRDDRLGTEDVYFSKVVNERPIVSILFPVSGSVRDKLVNVAGNCSDPDTSPSVQVEVQLKEKGGDVVMPWTQATVTGNLLWNITINSTHYANGDYEIWARSYDGALYSIEGSIDVTFDNGIQPFVDLTIAPADISFSPAAPVAGDQVTISADVSNLGNSDAANVQVQFLRGAVSIGYTTISIVPAGGKANTLLPWTALEGTFIFHVSVDPNLLIDEANESNNQASQQLEVGPAPVLKPDLEISPANISHSPSIAHEGEMLNISAKVHNFGELIAANVKVEFKVGQQAVTLYSVERRINSINPGEFNSVYINWTPPSAGTYEITVTVDPMPYEQDEDDRTNNQAIKALTVYDQGAFKADLAISDASVIITPVAPKIGQNVTIGVIVSNLGDVAAEAVQVAFYMDSLLIGTQLIPVIEAMSANDTQMIWLGALGNHALRVVVDEGDTIVESNESNNQVQRVLTVYPAQVVKPDLSVEAADIIYSPDPPERDVVLQFNVTVRNLGNDSASNVEVLMYLDGTQLGGPLTIGFLAPGGSTVLVGRWMATGGKHTFEVVVDPDGEVEEWSVDNNQAEVNVELPGDPIAPEVYLIILGVVAFSVLGFGVYSIIKKRRAKKP